MKSTATLMMCFSLLVSSQVRGQQVSESQSTATLRISTRLVVLDVGVTDRQGHLVQRSLTRDDFTIVEDGTIQQIRTFEAPDQHRMPENVTVNSTADLKKIGNAPVTILVLDELNSRFEDMSYSRQEMVKYLKSEPRVLSTPTVLLIATNRTFQQVHDYTQDRDALIKVVQEHMPEYPFKAMNGSTGPGAVERMAQTMGALQQIAQASSGTPGRKNLIWVGNGFPSADLVTLDTQEANAIEAAFRRVLVRLLAARITMYSINPAAGDSSTVDIETPADLDTALNANGTSPFDGGTVGFSKLAPSTGGIAFTGRNDINNVIAEGIDKGRDYYTLSYVPTGESENAAPFRNIKVVMKDKALVATTRNGYFPETASDLNSTIDKTLTTKQVAANLKLDLSAALTTTVSYNGLTISAVRAGAGTYMIHVANAGIGWFGNNGTNAQHAEATVAAGWYDARGKLLGHAAEEQFAPQRPDLGADFKLQIQLPPRVARLRFVVRDAFNGRMGTCDLSGF